MVESRSFYGYLIVSCTGDQELPEVEDETVATNKMEASQEAARMFRQGADFIYMSKLFQEPRHKFTTIADAIGHIEK